MSCKCGEHSKPVGERRWGIIQRNCNFSAFSGYHWTVSDYSCVTCLACRAVWRTKAGYVPQLRDATLQGGNWAFK